MRRKTNIPQKLSLAVTMVLLLAMVTSCQSSAAPSGTDNQSSQKVTVIYVGGANDVRPISFLDENNELAGYDIDLLKEIDSRIPELEFKFQGVDFPGLFSGLDSKKFDIATCMFAKNKEREEKYLFSKGYINVDDYITVLDSTEGINSLEDLKGKVVEVGQGSDLAFLAEYNKNNPGKEIILLKGSRDPAVLVKNLLDGRSDAVLEADLTRSDFMQNFDIKLKKVGEPVIKGSAHFLIRKDIPDLKEKVNKALEGIIADGIAAKISIKWYGDDYTKNIGED
jgi:ABC-type amino acid transport substrate-binding protein